MSLACSLLNPLCWLSSGASNVFSSFFSSITSWIVSSSDWIWGTLGSWLSSTSDPTVVLKSANTEFQTLLVLAPFVALCAFVGNVLTSLRHGGAAFLVRELLLAAPLIVFGVVAARPVATLILNLVEALSAGAVGHASDALKNINTVATNVPSQIPGFLTMILALLGVLGAVILWFELLIRNAVLALLLVLSPVVFAAALWAPLRKLAVRLAEAFIVVALTKFVIVVALALGATAVNANSVYVTMTGIAVVMLAVLTPFALLRIIPMMEVGAIAAVEGMRQRATSAVRRGALAARNGVNAMAPDVLPDFPNDPPWPDLPWYENTIPFEELSMPPLDYDGPPPVPPIREPTLRTGHRVFWNDKDGPVMGWHWDD